jgi:hypothetical protein
MRFMVIVKADHEMESGAMATEAYTAEVREQEERLRAELQRQHA